jgi:hypothetical protein
MLRVDLETALRKQESGASAFQRLKALGPSFRWGDGGCSRFPLATGTRAIESRAACVIRDTQTCYRSRAACVIRDTQTCYRS